MWVYEICLVFFSVNTEEILNVEWEVIGGVVSGGGVIFLHLILHLIEFNAYPI